MKMRSEKSPAPPARKRAKGAPTAAMSFDPMRHPGVLFRRLASHSHAMFHEATKQDEVTPPQLTALTVVLQKGPITQTALSGLSGIDKNTLGEMLKRMQARGLVERIPHETDRRSLKIAITGQGRACVEEFVGKAEDVGVALLKPLPPRHRAVFLECLHILASHLDAPQPQD